MQHNMYCKSVSTQHRFSDNNEYLLVKLNSDEHIFQNVSKNMHLQLGLFDEVLIAF